MIFSNLLVFKLNDIDKDIYKILRYENTIEHQRYFYGSETLDKSQCQALSAVYG